MTVAILISMMAETKTKDGAHMPNNIYKVLDVSENKLGRETPFPHSVSFNGSGDKWLVESITEDGLNVKYQLWVVYPQGIQYQLILPWVAQEICPQCQGLGTSYSWQKDNAAYEKVDCPACLGDGSYRYNSEIRILIDDGLGGQKVIRKRQAGRFNARLGLRGDLIVNLTWVDELPLTEASGLPESLEAATIHALTGAAGGNDHHLC